MQKLVVIGAGMASGRLLEHLEHGNLVRYVDHLAAALRVDHHTASTAPAQRHNDRR